MFHLIEKEWLLYEKLMNEVLETPSPDAPSSNHNTTCALEDGIRDEVPKTPPRDRTPPISLNRQDNSCMRLHTLCVIRKMIEAILRKKYNHRRMVGLGNDIVSAPSQVHDGVLKS